MFNIQKYYFRISKESPSSVSVFHESDHEKTKREKKKTEHVKYQSYHSDNSVFSEKMKKSIISNSSKYPRNYEFDVPRHPSDPNFKLKRNKDEYSFTGEIIDFKFPKTLSNGQMQGGYGKIKLEVGDKFYYAYFHVSAVLNRLKLVELVMFKKMIGLSVTYLRVVILNLKMISGVG